MISVIIPSYNRATFIKRALNNISEQTFKDVEVIIVDDGSTDNTREIIDGLKDNYGFDIAYYFQKNQGAAAARQSGVNNAKGDFLAFFDSDDLWHTDYLSSLIHALEFSKLDWIYCPVERRNLATNELVSKNSFYPNGCPRNFVKIAHQVGKGIYALDLNAAIEVQLKNGIYMGFQNTLFKKQIFEKVKIPNLRIGQDRLMALVLLKNKFHGGFIEQVLATVYEHEGNTTSSGSNDRKKVVFTYTQLIMGYEKYTDYVLLDKAEEKIIYKKIANFYFWHLGYSEPIKRVALTYMWKGIKRDPLSFSKLKSFFIRIFK
ncbi:glycosyltransferase family 2 protein [Alteromonas sp. CyTr2]|uniref:glycosyltransferase family 2 protein n=1 Tax=Alteromonas sp. CyTr2 TaxID=2935039 RepID=UPI00248D3F8E|nr:glycosyltransferase family 2 protein [Alteromonas sp. CyTr2]